jgi:hypothetical protein
MLGEEYRSWSCSLCSFLHYLVSSSLLGPNMFLNTLFSDTLSLRSSLNVSDQLSDSYKATRKIIVLYIWNNYHRYPILTKSGIMSTEFSSNFQHQISWQSVQQLCCRLVRTDGRTYPAILRGTPLGYKRPSWSSISLHWCQGRGYCNVCFTVRFN